MENFIGLLYNSGTTQEGLGYKNGFGSSYVVSGGNPGDIGATIRLQGISNTISETQGFIFWMRFNCYKLSTAPNDSTTYFFSSRDTTTNGTFSLGMGLDNQPFFSLYDTSFKLKYLYNQEGLVSLIDTGITYNIIIYKNRLINFTDTSGFTSYVNNFKYVHNGFSYSNPNFTISNADVLRGSSGASSDARANIALSNMGMATTNMTPAEFDLFAKKMYKYDCYWHLFEGETDTPNINKSDLVFYTSFYQKMGNIIEFYPKSNTKYGEISSTSPQSRINLGNTNRWKKPYPPYDPYI